MFFDDITLAAKDLLLEIQQAFDADPRQNKIDLSVGYYRDATLTARMFPTVFETQQVVGDKETQATYLPIEGQTSFIELHGQLTFGKKIWEEKSICGVQTVGGTSALHLAAKFYATYVGNKVYLPNLTWANHRHIFSKAGFDIEEYFYYSNESHHVDFDRLISSIKQIPKKSMVLFHACCHNPTGADLTTDQWKILAKLVEENQLMPLFDMAYQGLSKDVEEDNKAIEIFIDQGLQVMVATSCSKNFSLYCHRTGALYILCKNKENVKSQLKRMIRAQYSNPPAHGAFIVTEILQSPRKKQDWIADLKGARERITEMRKAFVEAFDGKIDYKFLLNHNGFFSFTGLTKQEVKILQDKYAIYIPSSGRINICGLNKKNIPLVKEAILSIK